MENITINNYFKVIGADIFCKEEGYVSASIDVEGTSDDPFTKIGQIETIKGSASESLRRVIANNLEVPIENVISVSEEEYLRETGSDNVEYSL